MSDTKSFVAKEVLKPLLSELLNSKVFNAGFEVCSGIRIIFNGDKTKVRSHGNTLEIDLFDESEICCRGTFEIHENEKEIFNKIKSAIIEFASNKQTYTLICEDGVRSLIESNLTAAQHLEKANDIILSVPSPIGYMNQETGEKDFSTDPYYEDRFEISYFCDDEPGEFFIKK